MLQSHRRVLVLLVGPIGFAFWRKQNPLEAEKVELSLHGLARVAVPATFQLQPGIWNYKAWYPDLPGRYPLVAPERAVDREKVTFVLPIAPRTGVGGAYRDDGELMLTLYRDDPGNVEPGAYFEALYPGRQIAPHLRGGPVRPGTLLFNAENQYDAAALMVDRPARLAAYLRVHEGEEAETRDALAAILKSVALESDDAGRKLDAHFARVDQFPARIRKQVADNLQLTNHALQARGFPAVALGRPSHHAGEAFALVEEPHPSGVTELWLQSLQPVVVVSSQEGLWLEEKLDERREMSGLAFLYRNPETGAWETSGKGQLTPEALQLFALPAGEPTGTHVHYVHRWPVHAEPWNEECWIRRQRELRQALERIETLRSYYRKTRERKLRMLSIPMPRRSAAGQPQSTRRYPVRKVRLWGYKDALSRMVIDFQYSDAQPFHERLAWVRKSGQWMALSRDGAVAFELDVDGVDAIWPFFRGWACFRRERYNYVDREGNLMFYRSMAEELIEAESFRGPYARVRDGDHRLRWIDTKGQWVPDETIRRWRLETRDWSVAGSPEEGICFLDADGRVVARAPDGALEVRPFSSGLAAFRTRDAGVGYMDRRGRVVIPAQYATGESFSEGYAAVCPDAASGLWTYIDTSGRPIAAPEFSEARPFCGGLALVKRNLYYYIDTEGRLQLPPDMS